MSPAIFISAFSVTIAALSLVVNFLLNHRAAVRARKPVLVFVDEPETGCWTLQNIGNGPALNVLVAQRAQGQWFNPVRVKPLGKDAAFPLQWLGRVNNTGLGATYTDFEGRPYTSTLGADVSRAYDGAQLPEWSDREIARYWELSFQPEGRRWAERPSDFQT